MRILASGLLPEDLFDYRIADSQVDDAEVLINKLRHYRLIFSVELTAEVLGDYSSGINHTLPTNTTARYRDGLSVLDFLKVHTSLRVDQQGLKNIGPVARKLAETEGLAGHDASVSRRLWKPAFKNES